MKIRNPTIDVMKGLGIVLVVLFHATGMHTNAQNTGQVPLFNALDSFIMPLFFILSGYLSLNVNFKWTWQRIKLVLPILIIFSFIYWPWVQIFPKLSAVWTASFVEYLKASYTNGFFGAVTWYLWTLLCCYLLISLFNRLTKINIWLRFGIFSLVTALIPLGINYLGIDCLRYFMTFFLIGYMLRYLNEKYEIFHKYTRFAYTSLVLFPLVLYSLDWLKPYGAYAYINYIYRSIPYGIINDNLGITFAYFILALLGIACVYSVCRLLILKNKYIKWVFVYLGMSSIGIYLLHILFIGAGSNILMGVSIVMFLSIVFYELLSRKRRLNLYLFGSIKKPVIPSIEEPNG
jgi:fucose 4-O-acetylase-like acetyltransferase